MNRKWLGVGGVVVVLAALVWILRTRAPAPEPTEALPADAVEQPAAVTAAAAPPPADVAAQPMAAAPTPDADPMASQRIRQFPRKKRMEWQVDLDADGKPETLVASQKQAADAWLGGTSPGGPVGSLTVRHGASAEVIFERHRSGYAMGMFALAARIGGGRHVVLAMEGAVDGPSELPGWLASDADGTVAWHEMKRVPLALWDLDGAGLDVVLTMSTELYQDYLPRGTMDVMAWRDGGFVSVMPFVAFEVCALEPDGGGPLVLVAVSRKKPGLHVLAWHGERKKLVSKQRIAVEHPHIGAPYNVPRGFALACSFARERPHWVQYKNGRYRLGADGKLAAIVP